jgi:hypothetical protein
MMNPFTAALYAGLAPEGSSFDTKGAAKAAALQQIGEYAVKQMQAQGAPGMEDTVGSPSGGGPGAGAQGPYGGTVGTNPNAPPISNPAINPPATVPNMGSAGDIGYTPSTPTIPNMGTTADIGDYLAKHSIDPTSGLPPPPPPPTGIQSAIDYVKEIPTNIRQGIEVSQNYLQNCLGKL